MKMEKLKDTGLIRKLIKQFLSFMVAGLPSFIIAVPLNWLLVEQLALHKSLAYFITLLIQVSINFFMLRKFVFKSEKQGKILHQYFRFLGGISFFRFLDWGLYSLLVTLTSINYILIQLANVFIFSIFKFVYSKFILDQKSKP